MIIGSRWLEAQPELDHMVGKYRINDDVPTRTEEFTFVRDVLKGSNCKHILDAGTGFAPGTHIMPYILADEGMAVLAVDTNKETLNMPKDRCIDRVVHDICDMTAIAKDEEFDAWISVSVLEHLDNEDLARALKEAHRVIRPGGLIVITMDQANPTALSMLLASFGFAVGIAISNEPEHPLNPPVGVIIGVKPL